VRFRLSEIAAATGGVVVGPDVVIHGVSIDSRDLPVGALFVPVVGGRDGHDFILAAIERGASAYLSDRPPPDGVPPTVSAVQVPDTARALTAIGRVARDRLDVRVRASGGSADVVGITGSVGKTSTKDLLAAILATTFRSAASVRSFNNELGVPLTLANAPDGVDVVVVEMGARGTGHIAELCEVARPTIGIVTAVEMVHTEHFGALDEVAAAKAELVEALPATGTAVLNADSPLVAAMADRTAARVLRFGGSSDGRSSDAGSRPDLWASNVITDADLRSRFRLHSPWGAVDVHLGVRGAHNVANALAAAGAALVCGVDLAGVATGLARAQLSPWRMELTILASGARVLNDAYNAGPASMASALQALAALGADRPVAVLGEMAELGADAPAVHRQVAQLAESLGIRVVALASADYGPSAAHAADLVEARALLAEGGPLGPGDAVLVKGSRVAGLERLAALLLAEAEIEIEIEPDA
jgi:UDP-N-acetylmuramoyl-tripeptide--D-alanyl-D-alanine ligase